MFLQTEVGRAKFQSSLSFFLKKQTGWNLEIAHFQETQAFHWNIRGVALRQEGQPAIFVDSLTLALSPRQLFMGRLHFPSLVIDGLKRGDDPLLGGSGSLVIAPLQRALSADMHLFLAETPEAGMDVKVSTSLEKPVKYVVEASESQTGLVHTLLHLADQPGARLKAEITTLSPRVEGRGEIAVEGRASLSSFFKWDSSGLHLHDLKARAFDLTAKGKAWVMTSGRIEALIQVKAPSLEKFSAGVQGALRADVHAKGTFEAMDLEVDLSSDVLNVHGQEITGVGARLQGEWKETQFSGEATVWGGYERLIASSSFYLRSDLEAQRVTLEDWQVHLPNTTLSGSLIWDGKKGKLEGGIGGKVPDLSLLGEAFSFPIKGNASVKAEIKNALEIALEASELEVQGIKSQSALLTAHVDLKDWSGKSALIFKDVLYGGLHVNTLNVNSWGVKEREEWPFKINVEGNWEGAFHLVADGNVRWEEAGLRVTTRHLKGRVRQELVELETPASFLFTGQRIHFDPMRIVLGEGKLEGHGTYSPKGVEMTFKANELPLAWMNKGGKGTISGQAAVSGPALSPEVHLQFTVGQFVLGRQDLAFLPPLNGAFSADFQKGMLSVNGGIYGIGEEPLHLDLALPATFRIQPSPRMRIETSQPLALEIKASGEISPILEALLPGVTHLTGHAQFALNVGGTLEHPKIGGGVQFQNCTFEILSTGCVLKNIEGVIEAQEDRLILKHLTAKDGEQGEVTGSGEVHFGGLSEITYDLAFALREVVILRRDFARGLASGNLQINGKNMDGVVSGTLTTTHIDVALPQEMPGGAGGEIEVTFINEETPTPTANKSTEAHSLKLNVDVQVADNLSIHSQDLRSQWRGNLHVGGTTENVEVKGGLQLTQGEFKINGKPFDLKKGEITFAGDVEKDTTLNIVASQPVNNGYVEVVLRGSTRAPVLSLRANPPMPQREILSWIIFGRGLSDASPFETTQLDQLALDLSSTSKSSSSKPSLFSQLQNLGIDRINVDSYDDGVQNHVSINIGKYITRGLYVSLNKGLTSEGGRVSVEADVMRNLKLKAEVSDDAAGKMLLMWRRDY